MNIESAIVSLCPRISALCRACLVGCDSVLDRWEIDTPLRRSHFFAQVLEETGYLSSKTLVENLNYSAQGLVRTWPSRFKTIAAAAPYARKPEAIANKVYGGRMGNVHPGDGWLYRGRGLLQPTGRAMYAQVGKIVGIDLESNPDLACDPRYTLPITCAVWTVIKGCNVLADEDDITSITRRINGGLINLDKRKTALAKVKAVLHA